METPEGLAIFQLGGNAEKWRQKILHPKSRMEKLGVKANASVTLIGNFEADFVAELHALTKNISTGKVTDGAEWIFFSTASAKDLAQVSKLSKAMQGAAALWVVYPKGQKEITENDVLAAGRKAGLKDVKVVGFSLTHTALKFVIPLASR